MSISNQICSPDLLLSFVTVSYNDSTRLQKTINSLHLYYNDLRFEHVVIDGASTDQTVEIAATAFCFDNFIFVSQPDHGIYHAMNRGIFACNAPYIVFLNCGDLVTITPSRLYEFLISYTRKSVDRLDILCCPFEEQGLSLRMRNLPSKKPYHKMPTSHQAMIFSQGFLIENPFDTRLKIAADFDVYLSASNVVFADSDSSFVLVEQDGVASSNPLLSYKEYLFIIWRRIPPLLRLFPLLYVLMRGFVVVLVKFILPKNLIATLKAR